MNSYFEGLIALRSDDLDEAAWAAAKERAASEWRLAMCLLAVERKRGFLQCGYSCIADYAEHFLGTVRSRAIAMMTVARKLVKLPLTSGTLERGELCWGKVRALISVMTPDNEAAWLEFARKANTRQIEKAVMLENEALRRELVEGKAVALTRAERAAKKVEAAARKEERAQAFQQSLLEAKDVLAEHGIDVDNLPPPVARERAIHVPAPVAPEPPRHVRVTLELTIDQYAIFEAAVQRVCQREGKTLSEAAAVAEIMRGFLASGDTRVRRNHPVVIRVDDVSGVAYYETKRGCLPASPEAVEDAVARGLQNQVAADDAAAPTAPQRSAGATTSENDNVLVSSPSGTEFSSNGFLDIPVCDGGPYYQDPNRPSQPFLFPLERANLDWKTRQNCCTEPLTPMHRLEVLMRANFRCEQCGGTDRLELDHEVPRCHGGKDCRHAVRVLCHNCHVARHEREHADDPTFILGRLQSQTQRSRGVLQSERE